MAAHIRSILALLLAGLPLLALFPFLSYFVFHNFHLSVRNGHELWLIAGSTLTAACMGALAFHGYRRLMWLLFCTLSFGAWLQGHYYRSEWIVRVEEGTHILSAAFALNSLVLAAIPLVVLARRYQVRVEPLIVVGFQAVLLAQVAVIGVPILMSTAGFSYGSALGFPFPAASLPVIDALGVRTSVARASGIGGSPNEAGAILLLAWPALLYNWPSSRKGVVVRGAAIVAVMAALMVTFTRGAYLGLLCQLGFLALVAWRQKPGVIQAYLKPAALVLGGVFLLAMASEAFRLRWYSLLTPTDASVLNRIKVFGTAFQLLLERPLCGWGVGTFNTLFNVFYSLPMVDYGYADAHSGILHGLLNSGLAAWALLVFALVGLRPWETIRRVPLWVLTALVGCILPLLSDNLFTRRLSASVPLCLLIGLCCVYGARTTTRGRGGAKYGYYLAGVLALLWGANMFVRPQAPVDRLEKVVKRTASRARADVALAVRNSGTGELWTVNNQHQPSMLATLSALARVCQAEPTREITVLGYPISPASPTTMDMSLPAIDWMASALSSSVHCPAGMLLQQLPTNELAASVRQLYGPETTATASLPEACETCGLTLGKADAITAENPLENHMTSATAAQLLDAFTAIVDTSSGAGQVAAAAMVANQDHTGLTRYLQRGPWLLHTGVDIGTAREEVLIVDKGLTSGWSMAVLYRSHLPARPRVDSVANRTLGELGWRFSCYFNALLPLATPSLPKVQHDN